MSHALRSSIARCIVSAILASGTLGAAAATLDTVADAVLGKPNLATAGATAISATSLAATSAVAEDPVTGQLWVADEGRHRVLRYASSAAFTNGAAADLVLGQADFTSGGINRGGVAGAGTLRSPAGLAVDQAGRLYVSDSGNHRILVFHPPHASGMNATAVVGQASFSGAAANRGATIAANTLSGPRGLSVDAAGNLFAADAGNHRVLRFAAPVGTGASANKVYGQGGLFTTATQGSGTAGLDTPVHGTVDGLGRLWVADSDNNRVLRFDDAAAGDTAADLVLCQANFTDSAAGLSAATCNTPYAVAVGRDGAVYVSDLANHRLLLFSAPATGAAANAVFGQVNFTGGSCNRGLASPDASSLCGPANVAIDRKGNLLAADYANQRLLRFDQPRNRVVPAIASLGPLAVPRDSPAFTLTVNGSGFQGDSTVNLAGTPLLTQYLAQDRLLAQVPANSVLSLAPIAVTVTNGTPGGGISAPVNLLPYARTALDPVADRVLGQPRFDTAVADNPVVGEERLGPANAATFGTGTPTGVAVDRQTGRLFVAEMQPAARVLSWPSVATFRNGQPADVVIGQPDEFTRGGNTGGIGAASLASPFDLAIDPAGNLYVADEGNHRVLRYSPPFVTGMSASRVFGQGGSFTSGTANAGGRSANSLNSPVGVAVDASRLVVLDARNHRVLVYDNPGADTTADVVIGQDDMATSGAGTSATRIGLSFGSVSLDGTGRIWVSDSANNRVLRFSPPFTNGMAADLVLGQPDFTSTSPTPTTSRLYGPRQTGFDPAGNLLVADSNASRVVRYTAPFALGMAPSHVLGQADLAGFLGGTGNARLRFPAGLAVDRVGNVIVADSLNHRVLAFDRPFDYPVDPAGDLDGDGIPNAVETNEGRDPYAKDNDVFAGPPPGPRLFAMQQYRDFLAREGDADGIVAWTGLVTTGAYTRSQVIDAFLNSAEFGGVIAPVVRLYFATFLRVPDYAGLTYNAGLVRGGTVSLPQLADFFVASPEFAATYGALNNTQFVTLLYQNVLGRAPDPAGLDGWVAILNGGASRGSVLLGFSESPEYQANMANEVFVTMMYAGMLRRTPEPVGYGGWLSALDAGTHARTQVIDGFYLSTEYRNRFLP